MSLFDISHLDDYHEKESVAVDPMSVDGISKDGMSRDGICFGVKRTDNMGLVYQKEFIWLWTEDTCSLKGLWKRILTRHCCCWTQRWNHNMYKLTKTKFKCFYLKYFWSINYHEGIEAPLFLYRTREVDQELTLTFH